MCVQGIVQKTTWLSHLLVQHQSEPKQGQCHHQDAAPKILEGCLKAHRLHGHAHSFHLLYGKTQHHLQALEETRLPVGSVDRAFTYFEAFLRCLADFEAFLRCLDRVDHSSYSSLFKGRTPQCVGSRGSGFRQ
ncbi:hypothetical protein GUJ93_ZPchr0003g18658 [Zizania palustris]|uniref:Uncharacterized protein n=1 Tax=Zizania palustris TaxID=103762 RepID=A0A8J5SVF8_ZIZPA|nr:hypothetical protein GUJ93_ZPchr0003g18658 [Zizania palustris]